MTISNKGTEYDIRSKHWSIASSFSTDSNTQDCSVNQWVELKDCVNMYDVTPCLCSIEPFFEQMFDIESIVIVSNT